jgi:DNA gyrase/topoisomerase IV subunit B
LSALKVTVESLKERKRRLAKKERQVKRENEGMEEKKMEGKDGEGKKAKPKQSSLKVGEDPRLSTPRLVCTPS